MTDSDQDAKDDDASARKHADRNGRAHDKPKARRGFAAMSPEMQREIASKGGKAAHAKGTAHEFTPEEAREAGRKGGQAVSRNRQHMSAIGSVGGKVVSRGPGGSEHMSDIGRVGGLKKSSQ
jgi:general stress protein YciG